MNSYNVTSLSKNAWNAPVWAGPIKIDTSVNILIKKVNKIFIKVFEILVWQSPRPIFFQKWQLVAKSSLRFAISKYKSK